MGLTTSIRMEKFEYGFVKATGIRAIVGKSGMKENAQRACKEFGPLIVPGGGEGRNYFEEKKAECEEREDEEQELVSKQVGFIA